MKTPPASNRVLILRTDPGPAQHLPWDFLLFGQMRVLYPPPET